MDIVYQNFESDNGFHESFVSQIRDGDTAHLKAREQNLSLLSLDRVLAKPLENIKRIHKGKVKLHPDEMIFATIDEYISYKRKYMLNRAKRKV